MRLRTERRPLYPLQEPLEAIRPCLCRSGRLASEGGAQGDAPRCAADAPLLSRNLLGRLLIPGPEKSRQKHVEGVRGETAERIRNSGFPRLPYSSERFHDHAPWGEREHYVQLDRHPRRLPELPADRGGDFHAVLREDDPIVLQDRIDVMRAEQLEEEFRDWGHRSGFPSEAYR